MNKTDKKGRIIMIDQTVDVDAPTELDYHSNEFRGTVSGIKEEFITVEDQNGDCFDVETSSVTIVDED